MKIAVPLDENKKDVCIVLARTPYFLFRENGNDAIVPNPAAQAQGGAGIQAAQFLVDSQADALITVRCGQNAAQVFQAAGIKLYKSAYKAAAVDLAALARARGIKAQGLRSLAASLLGFRISKSAQCSNWERDELSPQQIRYAATDAWVGRELYARLA